MGEFQWQQFLPNPNMQRRDSSLAFCPPAFALSVGRACYLVALELIPWPVPVPSRGTSAWSLLFPRVPLRYYPLLGLSATDCKPPEGKNWSCLVVQVPGGLCTVTPPPSC